MVNVDLADAYVLDDRNMHAQVAFAVCLDFF
jgi:hypothetical protein